MPTGKRWDRGHDFRQQNFIYTTNLYFYRFITVVGLYLIGGFIYQRLVVGAKGWEQLPNYSFWQDFGNLQAVSKIFTFSVPNSGCDNNSKTTHQVDT